MHTNLKKELGIIVIVLMPAIYLALKWNDLPDQVPSHWNIEGEVDGYSSKYVMPLVNILIYPLLLLIPLIDPRKKNYRFFAGAYFKIRFVLHLFLSIMTMTVLLMATGADIQVDRVVVTCVLLLFIALGNYMGNIRSNYFVGIRTPWTLENTEVWRRTHLVAGRLWFWGGLVCLIISFFISEPSVFVVIISVIAILSIVPVVYSYLIFRKLKKTMNTDDENPNIS